MFSSLGVVRPVCSPHTWVLGAEAGPWVCRVWVPPGRAGLEEEPAHGRGVILPRGVRSWPRAVAGAAGLLSPLPLAVSAVPNTCCDTGYVRRGLQSSPCLQKGLEVWVLGSAAEAQTLLVALGCSQKQIAYLGSKL